MLDVILLKGLNDGGTRKERVSIVSSSSAVELAVNDLGSVGPSTLSPALFQGRLLVDVSVHENGLGRVSLDHCQDTGSSVFFFQELNGGIFDVEFLEVIEAELNGLFLERTVFPVGIEGPGFVGDSDEVFNGGNQGLFDVFAE